MHTIGLLHWQERLAVCVVSASDTRTGSYLRCCASAHWTSPALQVDARRAGRPVTSFAAMAASAARENLLAGHHRQFLAFLRPRVESDAVAEDILQDAYAKSVSRSADIRDDDSVVAWFYQ